MNALADFHFLRPWFLLGLVPAGLLAWALFRRADPHQAWRGIIAPHLLPHLLSGEEGKRRIGPLACIAAGWLAGVVAVAGPAWRREPSPFADDTAALAIVVKVDPSMVTEDVQPSRLARAMEKVHDLLKARAGAKTALIAYAGTAHVVLPATADGGIIDSFAQALDPKIMPREGDAAADALQLADQTLREAGSGSILWIADGVAADQVVPLAAWRKHSDTPVRLWPPLAPGAEFDAVVAAGQTVNATVVALTPDDDDVRSVARAAKYSTVTFAGAGDRWQDGGYWFLPLLLALVVPFFRRGWMMRTAAKS